MTSPSYQSSGVDLVDQTEKLLCHCGSKSRIILIVILLISDRGRLVKENSKTLGYTNLPFGTCVERSEKMVGTQMAFAEHTIAKIADPQITDSRFSAF